MPQISDPRPIMMKGLNMKLSIFDPRGLLAAAVISAFGAGAALAEAAPIGQVDRVQNSVTADNGGAVRVLAAADPLYFGETLTAAAAARLEATLTDDTQITLGENSSMQIDAFVYAPGVAGGSLAVKVLEGTFLFVGGKVEGSTGGNVAISTPFATLGIRGTTVWGGPLDGAFAVFVAAGEVTVTNAGKTVTLTPNMGTMIADAASAPQDPVQWKQDKVDRAFATMSFAP